MKISILISLLLLFATFSGNAQKKDPVIINEQLNNIPFNEFAVILRDNYGVSIFYKPEWISGIKVRTSGDSLSVSEILYNTLDPFSIRFVKRNEHQFFLTGNTIIDPFRAPVSRIRTEEENMGNLDVSERYFSRSVFEKTINRAKVGNSGDRDKSFVSNITGRIYTRDSNEPVIGATIYVEGTNNGVISNNDGKYSLQVKKGSRITLEIACLGMESETYLVEVVGSGQLDIELTEKLIDIDEVIVTSGKNDNIRGMQMGFQSIEMKEIKNMPMVFGESDILQIANMTPGVQSTGEGSAGINVRGSSSDQNLFLLNDIPVLNTGHMFGFFSAFNSEMISNLNLYKSNYPAEYGGRLSSVFEISTKDGNKQKFGAKGKISPITGTLLFETPVIKNKSSIIIGARSTYSDWILNKIDDPDIRNSNASFNDFMLGFDIISDDNSSLDIFAYMSNDKFTLSNSEDFDYGNLGSSIVWNKSLNELWFLKAAAIFSRYSNYHNNSSQASSAFEHKFIVESKELKLNFTGFPGTRHKIGFGANAIIHNLDHGVSEPFGSQSIIMPIDFGQESGDQYSIYIFDELELSDRITIYGGLRYSIFNFRGPGRVNKYLENSPYQPENIIDTLFFKKGERIGQYSGPEYRFSLNYEINPEMSLKLSANRMVQYLFMLSNTIAQSPIDRWKLADSFVTPPVSDQISFGIYKNIGGSNFETSGELYYKKSKNIVEYKDGADLTSSPDFETSVLQGENNSYGIEFMLRRNSGKLNGWLSYTWARSLMTVKGEEPWMSINEGLTYPANYDKPHSLKFVANIKLSRRWSIGSNMIYNSGRPITYPTEIFYLDDFQVVNYSSRNEYRIPDYFRIDASLNIEGNLRNNKTFHGAWSFSVYNLTGRKNAYSVYLKNVDGKIHGYKQSIFGVPIFTISYNIKLGNYATE